MTIDEKLELFYKTAIDDATSQSVEMVDEYEKSILDRAETEKAEYKEKADAYFKIESEQLLNEKNKAVSMTTRDVKRQLLEEEKSFEAILFGLVRKKIEEYMKTEAYDAKLKELIEKAIHYAEGKEIEISINASDADKKEKLESETGATIKISGIDFIGGIRAVIRQDNLLIDQSYLTRLIDEKEAYSLD